MPRLLLFAPCQRAIIDRTDTSVSLIAVMNSITAESFEPNLSPDAVGVLLWAAVTIWEQTPGDEDRTFEQRVQIVRPDGEAVGEGAISFAFAERIHQTAVSGTFFPVGQPGLCQMRLSLRETGDEHNWAVVTEYPVEVRTHHTQEGQINVEG